MKINVESSMKQPEIIALLEAQEKPAYKYVGHPDNNSSKLQFEVENIPEGTDVVAHTKGLIKAQTYGRAIFFRVLDDGKFW